MRMAWLAAAAIVCALTGRAALAGPHPDLDGLWSTGSLTQLERPDELKALVITQDAAKAFEAVHRGAPPPSKSDPVGGRQTEWWELDYGLARIRGQVRTSWIVSPADGKIPFTAAAKRANDAEEERRKADFSGPEARPTDERCLGKGALPPLANGGINDNYQFVQAPDRLAIHAEWMHDVRIVRIGERERHPPPEVRVMGGDSIGRWEGATLVIETTNFQPDDLLAANVAPGADMRVVERISRVSPTELLYEFWVDDPSQLIQTMRGEEILHATRGPIYEFACHEGNYALEDILKGARSAERAQAAVASARR